MADDKEKPAENKEELKPSKPQTRSDELSESDVEEVAGGGFIGSSAGCHVN